MTLEQGENAKQLLGRLLKSNNLVRESRYSGDTDVHSRNIAMQELLEREIEDFLQRVNNE